MFDQVEIVLFNSASDNQGRFIFTVSWSIYTRGKLPINSYASFIQEFTFCAYLSTDSFHIRFGSIDKLSN
ncbi:MAG: hypothetical protein Q8S84_04140 [bacterium]|nr:hypothetical protein [bacterium]MDP3380694.1 hypothetical protein [bacterium]